MELLKLKMFGYVESRKIWGLSFKGFIARRSLLFSAPPRTVAVEDNLYNHVLQHEEEALAILMWKYETFLLWREFIHTGHY